MNTCCLKNVEIEMKFYLRKTKKKLNDIQVYRQFIDIDHDDTIILKNFILDK